MRDPRRGICGPPGPGPRLHFLQSPSPVPRYCLETLGPGRDVTDVTLADEDEIEEFAHRNVLSSTSTKKLAHTKYVKRNL